MERAAVGDLLYAGCEGCSYDPVVNILDKSVSRNQAWIELELPNDLLVQCAFFFSWYAWIFLYHESSLVVFFFSSQIVGKMFCMEENIFIFCSFFKLN